MNSRHRIVIVGASIAGLTAAESLRLEGFEGEILLIGDEPHLPYSRPPLSKQLLAGAWEPERTTIKSEKGLLDLGVRFRGSVQALKLDLKNRVVLTDSGAEAFDELIIATGARARRLGETGVRTLRNLDDAISLTEQLRRSKSLLVIGAGVLGSEIASAGRALGLEVSLVGTSKEFSFGSVGNALSSRIETLHLSNDVVLYLGDRVLDAAVTADKTAVRLASGLQVNADVAVAAVGATPCTQWLTGSGLNIEDGVVCDSTGAAAPGVYAVGDVAAWRDPNTGIAKRLEHQTSAIEQAMSVAGTIVKSREASPSVPFFWSDVHGVGIKAYGWFDGQPLRELPSTADSGVVLASEQHGQIRGVVAWNASTAEFRRARLMVNEASKDSSQSNLMEAQK